MTSSPVASRRAYWTSECASQWAALLRQRCIRQRAATEALTIVATLPGNIGLVKKSSKPASMHMRLSSG